MQSLVSAPHHEVQADPRYHLREATAEGVLDGTLYPVRGDIRP